MVVVGWICVNIIKNGKKIKKSGKKIAALGQIHPSNWTISGVIRVVWGCIVAI